MIITLTNYCTSSRGVFVFLAAFCMIAVIKDIGLKKNEMQIDSGIFRSFDHV